MVGSRNTPPGRKSGCRLLDLHGMRARIGELGSCGKGENTGSVCMALLTIGLRHVFVWRLMEGRETTLKGVISQVHESRTMFK